MSPHRTTLSGRLAGSQGGSGPSEAVTSHGPGRDREAGLSRLLHTRATRPAPCCPRQVQMNPQPARPKANVTLTRSSRHVSWKPNLAGELLAPGPAAVSARGPEAGPPPRPHCRWRVTGTGLPASAWPLRRSGPCVPFQTWLHEELGAGRGPGHRLGSESAASRGSQGPVLSGSMPGRVLPQGLCICRSLAPQRATGLLQSLPKRRLLGEA